MPRKSTQSQKRIKGYRYRYRYIAYECFQRGFCLFWGNLISSQLQCDLPED